MTTVRKEKSEARQGQVPDPTSGGETPEIIIRPSHGWTALGLRHIWEYRELLYFLTWRDIKVRYKQTLLGGLWAIIQPFSMMVVFSVIFGRMARVPTDGVPYPIFAYAGLLPWMFFSKGLMDSANSLVGSQNLITKVYFPRLVIPISSVLSGLVDFALAFIVLIGMMFYYGIQPTAGILVLPALVFLTFVTSLGVGLWFSAMNVRYRDVRYTVPFLTQLWLFATPVGYPSSLLEEPWRTVYGLNPMVGVVEGFRWALVGAENPPQAMVVISTAMSIFLMITGMFYFRRMERTFADIV